MSVFTEPGNHASQKVNVDTLADEIVKIAEHVRSGRPYGLSYTFVSPVSNERGDFQGVTTIRDLHDKDLMAFGAQIMELSVRTCEQIAEQIKHLFEPEPFTPSSSKSDLN